MDRYQIAFRKSNGVSYAGKEDVVVVVAAAAAAATGREIMTVKNSHHRNQLDLLRNLMAMKFETTATISKYIANKIKTHAQ